jgi:hypothetical protein
MCDRTNQAGHMIASDPIKSLLNVLARRRPSTYAFLPKSWMALKAARLCRWGGNNRTPQLPRAIRTLPAVVMQRLPNSL